MWQEPANLAHVHLRSLDCKWYIDSERACMTRPQVRRVLSFLTPGNIIFTVCFDAYQYPLSDMCIIGRERARELNKRVHIASSRPPAQPLASSLSFSRHVGRIFPTVAWQVRFTLHQVTYAPWVETWTILVLPQCGAFQISTTVPESFAQGGRIWEYIAGMYGACLF